MSRALSTAAKSALFAQETDEAFLILLTINHVNIQDNPIRVVNNRENIDSRGETFIGFPFEISLPDEDSESVAQVELRIDNVDRRIVEAVRAVDTPPTVTIEVVMASTPDVVEGGPFEMKLTRSSYDAFIVTGTLGFEPVLDEPYPGDSFIRTDFPGLF